MDELERELQNQIPRDLRETIRELMQIDGVVAADPDDFVERVYDLVVTQVNDTQYRVQVKKMREWIESAITTLSL